MFPVVVSDTYSQSNHAWASKLLTLVELSQKNLFGTWIHSQDNINADNFLLAF